MELRDFSNQGGSGYPNNKKYLEDVGDESSGNDSDKVEKINNITSKSFTQLFYND